jgi:hypothetical protein
MVARTGELRKLGSRRLSDWSTGNVVIWDNDAIQHKAIDDYGNEPCTMRVAAPAQLPGVTWSWSMAKRCAEFGPSKDLTRAMSASIGDPNARTAAVPAASVAMRAAR